MKYDFNLTHAEEYLRTHARYGNRIDPARDWRILLVIATFLLVAIAAWSVVSFDRIEKDAAASATASTTTSAIAPEMLSSIQAVFANRAMEEETYENAAYPFVDPSK